MIIPHKPPKKMVIPRVQSVDAKSTASTFSLVPNQDTFVYVYASWCGHCQRFNESGIWDELVKHESKKMAFAKIENEVYSKFGLKHDVHAFPSFFFVHANGKIVDYHRGRNLEEMKKFIHDEQQNARTTRRALQSTKKNHRPHAAAGAAAAAGGGRTRRGRQRQGRRAKTTRTRKSPS